MWLANRRGVARIGLLDFQDALFGPSPYDVASLLQDARATVPPELEAALLRRYLRLREANDTRFDAQNFINCYAICGAQRAMKALGIFARLADQAGRTGYLRHMPRLRAYLDRTLASPVLSDLALWYEKRLPPTV
jgi:aminoglycoside/choline kinase family phosphotransferase